jgi:hypothetical protein
MKRISGLLRTNYLSGLLIAGLLVLAACNKNDNDIVQPPAAGLMAFNLATDKAGIGFRLGGNNLLNSALGYTNYTGDYLPVYTGTRNVEAFDVNSTGVLASVSNLFEEGKYYSLFLVGKDSTYANVIVNDNLDTLAAETNKAYIRYINAIADSSALSIDVTAAGSSVIRETASFKRVSEFVAVPAGDISFTISNETSSADTTRTFAVEASKVYTILLAGEAGSVDPVTSPQIKYILNGTITP